MKQHQSKKHHYLPQEYLKGFTDSAGGFYVYDKQTDNLFHTGTVGAFYENKLNTVVFPDGSTTDFLEKLYTMVENESWNCLDRIRTSGRDTRIDLMDKMKLFLFLLVLHWRLPNNSKVIEVLSKEFFRDNRDYDYFRLSSVFGNAVSEKAIEQLVCSDVFKKIVRLIVPFAPFCRDPEWFRRLDKWRFLYTGDNSNWFMVGDNPIISIGQNDHDPIRCLDDFLFPVSGKILLISGKLRERAEFPPDFIMQFNVAIIERAQRFAAHQRKDFLEAVIKDYKFHIHYGKTDTVIKRLFELL